MTLKPFQRDPSEEYSPRAEIENFFSDWMEVNRAKIAAESKEEKE